MSIPPTLVAQDDSKDGKTNLTSYPAVSALAATIMFIMKLMLGIANYVIFVIPSFFWKLLHRNFSVTLSLSSIIAILLFTFSTTYYLVRQRYLRKYSADTTPQNKHKHGAKYGEGIDFVTGAKKQPGKDGSKNYLDEFLSAIKVFGYLEKPVFHELTKNMTTQKISNDEMLCLDESVGFSIVVEGTIQVYSRMEDNSSEFVELDEHDRNYDMDETLIISNRKYYLLNEVKSGSPLSSLLSTVDLFKSQSTSVTSTRLSESSQELSSRNQINTPKHSPLHPLDYSLNSPSFNAHPETMSPSPTEEAVSSSLITDMGVIPSVVARPKPSSDGRESSATIAIIPYSAFQRVLVKFPKSTSHIVTMILTRLYKVTFNVVHNYLGLTKEITETEVALNLMSEECKLPSHLVDVVMENLDKSKTEDPDFSSTSSTSLIPKSTKKARKMNRESSSRYVILASRSKASHPGDLLSAVPLSRRPDFTHSNSLNTDKELPLDQNGLQHSKTISSKNSFVNNGLEPKVNSISSGDIRAQLFSDEQEETEETSLRTAIVENLFKLLGVDENVVGQGFKSAIPSANSSTVGLSSLMNDSSASMNNIERYFHDSMKQSRFSSISTVGGFSSSQKLYPTFYRSSKISSGKKDTPSREVSDAKLVSTSSKARDFNFATVKSAFGKNIEVKYYAPGSTLVSENSFDTGIFYVISGTLDVSTSKKGDGDKLSVSPESRKLYSVKPGGLAGYLSTIVGFRSLVSVKSCAIEGAVVAYISRNDFQKLIDKFYFLQLPVAAQLKRLLPTLIKTIDFALEWCHIPAGGVLASQGDLANGFHIVLSGRFRVVRDNSKVIPDHDDRTHLQSLVDDSNAPSIGDEEENYTVLGEYGHGQSIGEVEVLTASRRTNSLIAVRDSETTRIPRTLFEMLSLQNPAIMVKVSRIVANRVLESNQIKSNALAKSDISRTSEINREYKTITILPSVSGLPVREFAERLTLALKAIGRDVIALDRASTLNHLGRYAFDERLAQLKLSGYFAYLEEKYETIVYICDTPLKSDWTSTCISQGDCILLLADAEDDECATNVGDYERLLLKLKTTAKTDLCLIHSDKSVIPGSTSIWLKNRIWIQDHHHIEMDISRDNVVKRAKKKNNILLELAMKISSKANPNIKLTLETVRSRALASWMKLNNKANKKLETPAAHKSDFMRLARILSNEAVGLVLGGGGSRGISHVGVVTALEKHGIPVDVIGGTSIGSFVGGLYAKENNIVSIYGMSKKFSTRVGSLWRNIFDLTYPVTSYITGYEFNRGIWKVFGYHEIEDFWIKYYCNSTNITNSKMEIHERGYAWRFIRASMSLAGLLPPIAYNGSMLLDGGYLDNLPVSEMKNRGVKHIIAVDVGSVDDRTPMSYGDTLSGFWVLFNRINPFSKHPNVPNMMDIQLRLAYVASVYALELAKKTPGVIYLRPPIDDYATLDFLKFDEIYNVGLAYADGILSKWETEQKFPKIAGIGVPNCKDYGGGQPLYRRNSI